MPVGGWTREFAVFCKSEIRKIIKEKCDNCEVKDFDFYGREQYKKCGECEHWKKMCSFHSSMFEYGYVDIYNDEE